MTGKKFEIPEEIIKKLKIVKNRYFKEETIASVKQRYVELFKEKSEEYKETGWNDIVIHKRTLSAMKNTKQREMTGGSVEQFYGVILGASKIRDLSEKRRAEIFEAWKRDAIQTMRDGLVLVRRKKNPTTGMEELSPILGKTNEIIPADTREYFKRKDGSTFPNSNFGQAIPHAFRRNVFGICTNTKGITGVKIIELRDKQVDIDVPIGKVVKFTAKNSGSSPKILNDVYISDDTLDDIIGRTEEDFISEIIVDEEYKDEKIKLLNAIKNTNLIIDLKLKLKNEEISKKEYNDEVKKIKDSTGNNIVDETYLFKLKSSKGTRFNIVENKEEIKKLEYPMRNGEIDIDLIYKKYFPAFSSDCSKLVKYHNDNRYIADDVINYDEFVVLHDVNLVQFNMEPSLSGNFTMYVDDESMFVNEIIQNDELVDSIKILVPSYLKPDFGADSRVNIIGAPFQFISQDENQKSIFIETGEVDEKGNPIKEPVLEYASIIVYGIYPIPEYKIEIEEIDMSKTTDEGIEGKEINVGSLLTGGQEEPKEEAESEDAEEDEEEIDEDLADDEVPSGKNPKNPDDLW